MIGRHSKGLLRKLRNEISIEFVIRKVVNLPWKTSEGYFRFLCPVCREFNTAVKRQTNLARCFVCERNFNPIDMYMLVSQANFRETVAELSVLLPDFEEIKSSDNEES